MTVTTVLGGPAENVEMQMAYALDMARRLGASLTGLIALPDPGSTLMVYGGGDYVLSGAVGIDAVVSAQDAIRDGLTADFEKAVAAHGEGVTTDLRSVTGAPHYHVSSAAAFSEAVIFPHGSANSGHALNPLFEHTLMDARLPVIIAGTSPSSAGPCLIAWDGSPQASRAVRFHLPLIQRAEGALILQNPERLRDIYKISPENSADALAKWLAKHDVRARTLTIEGDVSDGIVTLADEHTAGFVVMGAYGHSRMGEMLFGGTSRALLNADRAPALALCH